MDIWDTNKLVVFLAFVIPGFISIKTYQLMFPGTQRPTQDQLIDAVAYSSLNYALWSPVLIGAVRYQWLQSVWVALPLCLAVLLVGPVVWVLLWKWMRTGSWFQRTAPHPTALPWDFVFRQRKSYWMKVVLKDGTVVGGLYSSQSFSSSSPSDPQLYLQESWLLNEKGAFIRKKNGTEGVLIVSKEIAHIELRHYKGVPRESQPEGSPP